MTGGEDSRYSAQYHTNVYKYYVEYNYWTYFASMPRSLTYGRTIYFNGNFILFGVCFANSWTCEGGSYVLKFDGYSWEELEILPGQKLKNSPIVIPYVIENIS